METSDSTLGSGGDLESEPEDAEMSQVSRAKVMQWRNDNLMTEDSDFAFTFTTFQSAYTSAGRAVAMEWSRIRLREEPRLAKDAARAPAVAALAASIIAADGARTKRSRSPRRPAKTRKLSALRKPRKNVTEKPELESDKT